MSAGTNQREERGTTMTKYMLETAKNAASDLSDFFRSIADYRSRLGTEHFESNFIHLFCSAEELLIFVNAVESEVDIHE